MVDYTRQWENANKDSSRHRIHCTRPSISQAIKRLKRCLPILGLAQGLTAGSEISSRKTTLYGSAVPEATAAVCLVLEHRNTNAISSDFQSYLQSTELNH